MSGSPKEGQQASGNSGSDELRPKTKLIKDIEADMATLSIGVAPSIMAKHSDPGTLGSAVKIQTNAFGLSVTDQKTIFVYDINIHAELKNGKTVEFTKKARGDQLVLDRRDKCVSIIKAMFKEYKELFNDQYSVWYDGQAILYSVKALFTGDETFRALPVAGAKCDIADLAELECIVDMKVTKHNGIAFSQDAICKQTAHSNLSRNDHSLAQFAEIVLNQAAIMNPSRHAVYENGKTYMAKPWDEGFTARDCPELPDGKRLMVGTQKSVKQIEGPGGRSYNNPCLIIDAKKAAFHEAIPVIKKANLVCSENFEQPVNSRSLEKMNAVMRGVAVVTEYTGRKRTFEIHTISSSTALTAKFEKDGRAVSVADYFKERWGLELRYPNAPLLVARERGKLNQYPMEVCNVVPMQRVTVPQQTPEESQATTKNCAIPPSARQGNIMKGAKALEVLNPENPYTANAGIKVYANPMMVTGRILPGASLKYATQEAAAADGKWRSPRCGFINPASCSMWAIYCVSDGKRDRYALDEATFRQFADMLYKECRNKGMQIPVPEEMKCLNESEVHGKMTEAAKHNCQMCFFITSDSITTLHKNLKLWERELQMVTQDMKMSNACKVAKERKMMTLENVIMKTNLKLGGLNYTLVLNRMAPNAERWLHKGRLIIGIGLSHPPPSAVIEAQKTGHAGPTVLGYAANCKASQYDYVGDFIYQETRREEGVPSVRNVISDVVERFKESHDGRPPTELVIYRSGLAEGSFATIISHEVPLIRGSLAKIGAAGCKVVFIVAQKEHNVRLMLDRINPQEKPTAQNIRSGVVVDSQLTHPTFKEFYLNSHTTLQGSARTPRYTVLVDDLNMAMDEVEGMTYALAHNHQIVTLTTSLPAPLYIANRYAERGRNVLAAHSAAHDESSSTNSDSSASQEFARLTEKLGYKGSRLAPFRVNA